MYVFVFKIFQNTSRTSDPPKKIFVTSSFWNCFEISSTYIVQQLSGTRNSRIDQLFCGACLHVSSTRFCSTEVWFLMIPCDGCSSGSKIMGRTNKLYLPVKGYNHLVLACIQSPIRTERSIYCSIWRIVKCLCGPWTIHRLSFAFEKDPIRRKQRRNFLLKWRWLRDKPIFRIFITKMAKLMTHGVPSLCSFYIQKQMVS